MRIPRYPATRLERSGVDGYLVHEEYVKWVFFFRIDSSFSWMVGAVAQPVEDGVGHGRVADLFMSELQGELAGHQGGLESMPVFEDLQ